MDTDKMLPPDEADDALLDHHRDLDGPREDTSGEVETVDVDEATGEDAPDEIEDEDGEESN